MIGVSQGEGVYCLEVCGDIWTFSPSKYLYILQAVAVVTDNYYQHQGWGVRRQWRVFKFKLKYFPRNIKKVVGLFDVWSVQAGCRATIDPAELDTTDGRKCYLLRQWWIFWLILTPTLRPGYFSVCLILHYWDWDNLAKYTSKHPSDTHNRYNRPSTSTNTTNITTG